MDLADIGVKMWDEEKIKRFRKVLLVGTIKKNETCLGEERVIRTLFG